MQKRNYQYKTCISLWNNQRHLITFSPRSIMEYPLIKIQRVFAGKINAFYCNPAQYGSKIYSNSWPESWPRTHCSCTDCVKNKEFVVLLHMLWINFPDIEECASNPCQNKATCNDMVNMYTCLCPPEFTGTHCEAGKIKFPTWILKEECTSVESVEVTSKIDNSEMPPCDIFPNTNFILTCCAASVTYAMLFRSFPSHFYCLSMSYMGHQNTMDPFSLTTNNFNPSIDN